MSSSRRDGGGGPLVFMVWNHRGRMPETIASHGMTSELRIHQDTLSDDFLGEREIDLNLQDLSGEDTEPVPFDIVKDGKTVGKVFLIFCADV